ncbi:MAG: tetratricopeptide repeat protein [Xanthomonadaceae bacterium]|nr:tetratricopeptide repeat protein [Xanthomonadaceae bacterium]MDP2185469.1 tetratricopeptide repeat protein [Xanthomonadales bacterium]MDZ4116709.1 tetratricopeptide repeat protein [Xanthomonadaceae bacterium]MDZ4379228.1 tetratricopeptide repeat protein [Xanthomonadaceae bacterium]
MKASHNAVSAWQATLLVAMLGLLLVGCRGPVDVASVPVQVSVDTASLVAQVRAAADADDVLLIEPLRDTQTEDLRQAAQQLERQGDYRGALQRLQQAQEISPNDPALLQEAAELALLLADWDQAIALASRSFDNGPRLGPLCRRNWATVQLVREQVGDSAGSASAQAQRSQCTVSAPVRM